MDNVGLWHVADEESIQLKGEDLRSRVPGRHRVD